MNKSPSILPLSLVFYFFFFPQGLFAQKKSDFLKYSQGKQFHFLGDYYYHKQDYALAQIEYERALKHFKGKKKRKSFLKSKLALSFFHQEKFIEGTELLEGGESFSELYLSMFSSLRLGWISLALRQQGRILSSPKISAMQKEEALLLGGTAHIENREYNKLQKFYSDLQRRSRNKDIRKKSAFLLSSLKIYEARPKKSPLLGGALSALLPGSGQFYAKHYTDAFLAFFFNLTFLGSAFLLYNMENETGRAHYASGTMALIGFNFYFANILGGANSARRYNDFQERKFHQEVRSSFFNIDRVEKKSGAQVLEPSN